MPECQWICRNLAVNQWSNNIPIWLAFLFFQVGWFLIILGSQSRIYLACLPLLGVFLWLEYRQRGLDIKPFGISVIIAVLGMLFDSVIYSLDLIRFVPTENIDSPQIGLRIIPFWLMIMWLYFAMTLASCFRWLLKSGPIIGAIIAAIAGPAAYWGASRLIPLSIPQPIAFTLVSGLFWAGLFYIGLGLKPVARHLFANYWLKS